MNILKLRDGFASDAPALDLQASSHQVSAGYDANTDVAPDSPRSGARRSSLRFALIVGVAVLADSNWHNPLVIALIIALAVLSRGHAVKVTSSESAKDSHAFSLNGVCILALAALNGRCPRYSPPSRASWRPSLAPLSFRGSAFVGQRPGVQHGLGGRICAVRRHDIDGSGGSVRPRRRLLPDRLRGHLVADFISLLVVAAHNYLGYRQSSMEALVRYLTRGGRCFPPWRSPPRCS